MERNDALPVARTERLSDDGTLFTFERQRWGLTLPNGDYHWGRAPAVAAALDAARAIHRQWIAEQWERGKRMRDYMIVPLVKPERLEA